MEREGVKRGARIARLLPDQRSVGLHSECPGSSELSKTSQPNLGLGVVHNERGMEGVEGLDSLETGAYYE